MKPIDLNCDLGEGGSADAELLKLVTSANVCCGSHAGDPETALRTLRTAAELGVTVGAHPGYADREHFGRREMTLPAEQLRAELAYQIGGLIGLAKIAGCEVRYVKPHGALYNQVCRDPEFGEPLLEIVGSFGLTLMGLAGSPLQSACEGRVPFVAEGFADRRYREDGTLVPRGQPGAFVEDPAEAVAQVTRLVDQHGVRTVCVHGDNPEAVTFVREVRKHLEARGRPIAAFA